MFGNFDIIVLITRGKNANVEYLLGHNSDLAVLICTKKNIYVYINPLEYLNYKSIKSNYITYAELNFSKITKQIKLITKGQKSITIGLDYPNTTLQDKDRIKSFFAKDQKIKIKDCSSIFNKLRITKRNDELEKIKKACNYTDVAFQEIIINLKNKKFKTEQDISLFLKTFALKNNIEISFEPIVASGKNASKPHHVPEKKLNSGFMVLDFGFKYKGYCSDMTRTLYLGVPTKKEIQIYNKIKEIQQLALNKCQDNTKLDEVNKFVLESLGEYKKYMIHSLGHGVGLDIHELPFFSQDKKFKEGMIVAIEPGIYPSFGIRIEDTIQITKTNPNILTNSSKELIIIKKK
ncbi:M24 family metallopeptidase [Candidatus Woesearchaeota archaeon]|nr:M24 family metallopeptidase [Candidatus Woesearchaeota archaeon]